MSIHMNTPLTPELLAQLQHLSAQQLAFLAGYAWAKSEGGAVAAAPVPAAAAATAAPAAAPVARRVTVISASQTGNARKVAGQLADKLAAAGVAVQHVHAADYKPKQLADEDIVCIVTSTQGEGEPPEEAVPLYKLLNGKKAPKLDHLAFAVLGLGDSSYPDFCQAGRDFDRLLGQCGAARLADPGICDLDYQATATAWIDAAAATIAALGGGSAGASGGAAATAATAAAGTGATYSKEQPFTASLGARQKITARQTDKNVAHIEIDLGGSGITYQAGDALGVWPENDPALVEEILQLTGADGDAVVDGQPLRGLLTHARDITQSTPQFVQQYAALTGNDALQTLAADRDALTAYLAATPPVGILAEHPAPVAAADLAALFRAQTPRLYSIASSQDEVGDEVHLTVGVVEYDHHGNHYTGAASGYLGTRLAEGGAVRVFIEPNANFRLPADGATPIIMIGAGTGVAPFRAFMQARAATGATGDNWLIFGNRRFTDDFLYQSEWLQYRKDGILTRADLAWSRQGAEKEYVQHKIADNAGELWAWLQRGAHVYVCGDAARMARDVEHALIDAIAREGGMSADDAEEYLDNLRTERRYQRDVY